MNENFDPAEINETESTPEAPQPSKLNAFLKELLSWVLCIGIAMGIAFFLRTYVFMNVRVDGASMNPTLQHGQRIFTRIIGYKPERGDIIIFNPRGEPDKAYIKRVIAVEGDRIWIDETNGKVHLKKNGETEWKILDEPYIAAEAYNMMIPNCAIRYADDSGEEGLLIKEDHIFVMGDNRNHSNDSRNAIMVGQVSLDSVLGKASFRWWPLADIGSVY